MNEPKADGGADVPCISLLCPLCGWNASHRIAGVAAGKLDIHIRHGHTRDEINGAVDDGRVSEVNGKFGVGHNDKAQRPEGYAAAPCSMDKVLLMAWVDNLRQKARLIRKGVKHMDESCAELADIIEKYATSNSVIDVTSREGTKPTSDNIKIRVARKEIP